MDNNPSLLTFVMNVSFYILLLILLILWIIAIIHRRYIIFRNRQAIIIGPTTTTSTNLGPHGLDTSTIDTLPKFTYSRYERDFSAKLTSECAVCLGVFEEKEILRMLPKCGHVFHVDCVDTWLRMHATCPFCRDVLSENVPVTGEGPTSVEVVINVYDDRER